MVGTRFRVIYVTSSAFKAEENAIYHSIGKLPDGTSVKDVCEFEIRPVPIKEVLEVELEAMVLAEVTKAYSEIKVPCIVEHAGLIFDGHASYPGGLTKPMWNALGEAFVRETNSANRRATAKAVIAYCDGLEVHTFSGETTGVIAPEPRGQREFYWDTVFIPDGPDNPDALTYAELVQRSDVGLEGKVVRFSQSAKAMTKFLEYRRQAGAPDLWARYR